MMKRENLLRSSEYWVANIQNSLYGIIESYMKEKKLNRTELANELGVTKGYISQVLNGDFNHKVSKLVDLALSSGQVPLLNFINIEIFIEDDKKNMYYELFPVIRQENVRFASDKNYYNSYAEIFEASKTKNVMDAAILT